MVEPRSPGSIDVSVGTFLQSNWQMILGGITGLATAAIALFWSKYLVRFLLFIATVAIGIFAFTYKFPEDIDPRLPEPFLKSLRIWFFGLGLVTLYSLAHLVATLVRGSASPLGESTGAEGPFADLQAAWQEILIQLSKARIDPAGKDLYLLLGPDESLATSVIGAAGLQFFARAPASPDAPIHCHAVSDALFLSCSGASALGRQDSEGTARLDYLCRLIASLNPERPTLRGIAILLPFDWSGRPDFLRQSSAMRDDLQTIRRTLRLRCPTLTVCCLQESIPGFNDFASRLPANLRHLRCGFSVPIAQGASGAVIRRGMIWMIRWFQVWALNLMVAEIRDQDGNGRLLSMNSRAQGEPGHSGPTPRVRAHGSPAGRADPLSRMLFRRLRPYAREPRLRRGAAQRGPQRPAPGRSRPDHLVARGRPTRSRLPTGRLGHRPDRRRAHPAHLVYRDHPAHGYDIAGVGWAALAVLGLIWIGVLVRPRFRKKASVQA